MSGDFLKMKITEVESSDGFDGVFVISGSEIKQIPKAKLRALLGVGVKQIECEVDLLKANWVLSAGGDYYTHDVTIQDATVNSKVDMSPTPEQFVQLMNDEVTMFISNDNGTIKAYAFGGIPSVDMKIKVLLTEVVEI